MLNIRQNGSEFAAFIDMVRCLGIEVEMLYQLPKDTWQKVVDVSGCNITSNACIGIKIGSVVFIFSTGKPCWREQDRDADGSEGRGGEGSFIMAYDTRTHKPMPRKEIRWADGKVFEGKTTADILAETW